MGKSTVAKYLGRVLDVRVVEVGDFVRAEALRHNMRPQDYADSVFRRGSYLHFVEQALRDVNDGSLIIVGTRRPEEISHLRATLPNCRVVALRLSFESRVARARSCDAALLMDRDRVETSWGLGEAISDADVRVSAENTVDRVAADVYAAWCDTPDLHLSTTQSREET